MIVCNGVVGLCILVGVLRHRMVDFRVEGVTGALATLTAVATLGLVLPTFTTSTSGPTFSPAQLAFSGVAALILYSVFVFVQTVRHRDYFLPVETGTDEDHAPPPAGRTALLSLGLLGVCLIVVVGLAKTASPAIESAVAAVGAPQAVVGVTIALASIWLPGPLLLGLGPKEMVLLGLTVVVSVLTVATGRATLLQGTVHLVIFGAFLFLAVTP